MKVKKLLLLVCAFAPNMLMAQNNSITETKYWIDHQTGNWQTLTESPAEIDLADLISYEDYLQYFGFIAESLS